MNESISLHRHLLTFNDGETNFNNEAENLMMKRFNLMIDQLHHKIT